jgi:hypothetical protein
VRLSPSLEIYSRHGNSEECEPEFDPVWQVCDPDRTALAALDPGGNALHLGFIGGTDEHDTHPGGVCRRDTQMAQHPFGGGLTVAALPEGATFDRAALYDAIASRSTYATSGPLLPVTVSYRLGGQVVGGLGQDLIVPEGAPLQVEVRVPAEYQDLVTGVTVIAPRERVALISDGAGRYLGQVGDQDRPVWVYVRVLVDGGAWYGEDGCDDGGADTSEYLWLSPSWLALPEPDTGGTDDTGKPDTGTHPHDSDDSDAPHDSPAPCDCDCDCDCECDCESDQRGCGLLGVSGLLALALSALPLVLGRRTPRA